MTDSETDDREEIKGTMIDSNMKYGVLTMLFEPAIRTYSTVV